MLGLGFMLSSGVAFASSGSYVRSLFGNSSISVNGGSMKVHDLTYNGTRYYPINSISSLLGKAHITLHQTPSSLVISSPYESTQASVSLNGMTKGSISQVDMGGTAYLSANAIVQAFNNAGITASWNDNSMALTMPVEPPQIPAGQSVSLFTYPQAAIGANDSFGTLVNTPSNVLFGAVQYYTSSFIDGNMRVLNYPNLYGFSSNIASQTEYDRLFKTDGQFKSLTAILDTSSDLSSVLQSSDVGSLTITRGNGTVLYSSGPISSSITNPIYVSVDLQGVNEIEVQFVEAANPDPTGNSAGYTGGLGLINALLVR
jgi:hypothetical protein